MTAIAANRRAASNNVYRFGFFTIVVAIGMTMLGIRMFALQVVPAEEEEVVAPKVTATQYTPSNRGLIYDTKGNALVKNVVTYGVTVTPYLLPLDRELEVATKLGSILNLPAVDIETRIDAHPGSMYDPVTIVEGISEETARFIEENSDSLPGVKIIAPSVREYPYGDLYGQIVGYTGQITDEQYNGSDKNDPNAWKNLYADAGYSDRDTVGQAGLEYQYEQYLRGEYGSQTVSLDASGKTIPGLVTNVNPPVPGGSITLNIDTREQTLARQSLKWFIDHTYKTTQGVIIVQNPQNGKILAMVSLPGYDNNLFANGITQKDFQTLITSADQPLLNKAIGAQYAPGSTFKIVTATAGLDKGFGTTRTLMTSPYIIAGGVKFPDWTTQTWGALNITDGFAHSSDTFFYQMARDVVGIKDLAAWSRSYGFGQPTGIDLPGEAAGIVPDDSWKQANFSEDMYQGDIMHDGIGQGFDATTPLQVLNAYSAMANGGNLWTPQVVKSMTDAKGVTTEVQPKLLSRLPTSAENLEVMRLAARRVVTIQAHHEPGGPGSLPHLRRGQDGHGGVRRPRQERAPPVPRVVRGLRVQERGLLQDGLRRLPSSPSSTAPTPWATWPPRWSSTTCGFTTASGAARSTSRNAGSVNSWATRLSNPYGLNTRE